MFVKLQFYIFIHKNIPICLHCLKNVLSRHNFLKQPKQSKNFISPCYSHVSLPQGRGVCVWGGWYFWNIMVDIFVKLYTCTDTYIQVYITWHRTYTHAMYVYIYIYKVTWPWPTKVYWSWLWLTQSQGLYYISDLSLCAKTNHTSHTAFGSF